MTAIVPLLIGGVVLLVMYGLTIHWGMEPKKATQELAFALLVGLTAGTVVYFTYPLFHH